jgi:hypothetical protein
MNPGDATVADSQADRYISMPLAYWGNLTVLAGWLAMRLAMRSAIALHLTAAGLSAILLIAVMHRQESWERTFAVEQALRHESGIALAVGIEDADVLRILYPEPWFVLEQAGGKYKRGDCRFSRAVIRIGLESQWSECFRRDLPAFVPVPSTGLRQ